MPTRKQIEDFEVAERAWICQQINLVDLLKAKGWQVVKPFEQGRKQTTDQTKDDANQKSATPETKLMNGWDRIVVSRSERSGLWLWYKYTSKNGGSLFDYINPDISNLPHGGDREKVTLMTRVLRQEALRKAANAEIKQPDGSTLRFIPKETLIEYYSDKRELLAASIEQSKKILSGEFQTSRTMVSLLVLAEKYGFSKTEVRGGRQYFRFQDLGKDLTISVPIADPYVYREHGSEKLGGGVKQFKERFEHLRQVELPVEVATRAQEPVAVIAPVQAPQKAAPQKVQQFEMFASTGISKMR